LLITITTTVAADGFHLISLHSAKAKYPEKQCQQITAA